MNLANFFTASRIFLAPIFFLIFFLPDLRGCSPEVSVYILIPLFIFMEFTDFLDGFFARKLNSVSDFGKLFDPFADVLANLTVLFSFVLSGYLPSFLFLIILFREMGITFVRSLAAKKGVAIGARKGGKTKTVSYIVSAGFSLMLESAFRLNISLEPYGSLLRHINLALYVVAVLLSIGSFLDYLLHFSKVLRSSSN